MHSVRREQDVFDELAELCLSPGFAHALAYLCFRDCVVAYVGELSAKDLMPLFSMERLVRTELSTLIGLLMKRMPDYSMPAPATVQEYVTRTDALLYEIHQCMMPPFDFEAAKSSGGTINPYSRAEAMREPIFYGGESAYSFQYRDLARRKYASDDSWLIANKGFDLQTAHDVVDGIGNIQNERLTATVYVIKVRSPEQQTYLPAFIFTAAEVAQETHIALALVEKVLEAFAFADGQTNSGFCALNDFNAVNASPLLRIGQAGYILFQIYSLVEALYDAPFYWMGADKSYVASAMRHRGEFTEQFSVERLTRVFGAGRVHGNVDIFQSKDRKLGEIDVLVVFADRAIVLQAKSKRLTLEARRGNDLQIRDDFKKAIQDAYEQGFACATLLNDPKSRLHTAATGDITVPTPFKKIYVLCVVSDHYPALSFQTRQFLTHQVTEVIPLPFIMDVFTLDAMTELLESPLHFLSYLERRTGYGERLVVAHELTTLSYHLSHNLWISDEYDMLTLCDDITANLDIAMSVRREGIAGSRTPDGILTRTAGSAVGRIIDQIEATADAASLDLGFLLLTLSQDAVDDLSKGIDGIAARARADRKLHDLTMAFDGPKTGITIHCNLEPIEESTRRLARHCEARKYSQKADSWFGLCLFPDAAVRFGLKLEGAWKWSAELETRSKDYPRAGTFAGFNGFF